jgi:hypothetical protein
MFANVDKAYRASHCEYEFFSLSLLTIDFKSRNKLIRLLALVFFRFVRYVVAITIDPCYHLFVVTHTEAEK